MKWIHNDKVSLGWAIGVELAVHALFAFQAFLLGGFLGELALTSIFGSSGAKIGAWGLALFVFGAAFQAFVLGEYMQEHVLSFERSGKGNGSYIRSWKQVRWLVAGIELSSLAFRVIVVVGQHDYLQAVIVALFGLIALWYAYAQAKVIHASVNRPVEYDIMRAQHEAGRSLVKEATDYTRDMSPEQKARFVGGDISAVEEVAQSKAQQRQTRQQSKATKRERASQEEHDRYDEQRRAGETARSIFHPETWKRPARTSDPLSFPSAQSNQADHLSRNGNRN
jgi:hypothetical protein